jgi:hypothetical protein
MFTARAWTPITAAIPGYERQSLALTSCLSSSWMLLRCSCPQSAGTSRLSLRPKHLASRKPTPMALTPVSTSLWGMEYSVHGMGPSHHANQQGHLVAATWIAAAVCLGSSSSNTLCCGSYPRQWRLLLPVFNHCTPAVSGSMAKQHHVSASPSVCSFSYYCPVSIHPSGYPAYITSLFPSCSHYDVMIQLL